MPSDAPPPAKAGLSLRRAAPLALAAIGCVALIWFGSDYLSFEALRDNREALIAWRDANYGLAALAYLGLYIGVVALSFPFATPLTLAGGLLFGLVAGTLLTVTGATIGATLIFLAARTGLGDALRARAGGWLRKLEAGFRENEASYMLVLRLVPAAPFFIVNLAPAFLGVSLATFVWTTFLGIIPGTAVYTSIGSGLSAVFAAGETPDLGVIFRIEVLGPLLGLGALALVPAIVKAARGGRAV